MDGGAKRCWIPAFLELRSKIKRYFSTIVVATMHRLFNARAGSANNKIKLTIRTAYGFRNIDSLISMLVSFCSSVQQRFPNH
jgi:transposase